MLRGTASRRVVAVFSDAHGRENRALEVLMRLNACGTPADAVFFLGDGLRGFQHALSGAFPLTAVRGNCDGSLCPCFDDDGNEIPEERQVTVGSFRVLLMHGHTQEVKSHIGRAARRGLAVDADVVLFGHTHRPVAEKRGNLWIVNPGSLTYPRQIGRKPSYAMLTIDEEHELSVEIKYLE